MSSMTVFLNNVMRLEVFQTVNFKGVEDKIQLLSQISEGRQLIKYDFYKILPMLLNIDIFSLITLI